MPLNKIVNSIGKYLYKNLEGSYSLKKHSNSCEVKFTVLYQIPKNVSDKYSLAKAERDKVNVMDVCADVATYGNVLRVEILQITPESKTVAFKSFKAPAPLNVQKFLKRVLQFVTSSIEKEYEGYEVLF